MSPKLFSSLVLRQIIKEIGLFEGGVFLKRHSWAETMTTTYGQEMEEHPVLYLTESEASEARKYIAVLELKKVDVVETATYLVRAKHATDIRVFLNTRHDGWPVFAEHESGETVEEDHYTFPKDDRAPACFKEWFAVTNVWRLTLGLPGISYQDALIGTAGSVIHPLPEQWEEKLEECLKVTEASANIPVPRCWDLPLKRRDLDSILPTENESGLLTNGIIDSWFRILLEHREQRRPGCSVYIPPDSPDLAGSTPQDVAENKVMVDAKIDQVVFPTVIKEHDHCILVVVMTKRKAILVLDPLGKESTERLEEDRPWIKEDRQPKDGDWEVAWIPSPHPRAEASSGVFMLINSLSLITIANPAQMYTHQDTTFLRRYIAAVICMGKFPEEITKS